MKYIVIVPDGAADYPLEILGGKTPLEVAQMPFTKGLAQQGVLGRVRTVPRGFAPSSDVANLSLLGYNPKLYYTGRGPLEAANLGVELDEDDVALRCNFITEGDGKIVDYSAGHISNKEAEVLINYLNEKLSTEDIFFVAGKSYRHLLVVRGGRRLGLDKLKYFPPHDIMGEEFVKHLPRGKNSKILIDLMNKSKELLLTHQINKVRIDLRENPANMIWLWSCGAKPEMPSFKEKFSLEGGVISAVDLIKGIGKMVGLEVVEVEGATGYYDTNYAGKAAAALSLLEKVDFVFLHIEATDEAGHNQDLRMKISCLEKIDNLVIGAIVKNASFENLRLLITPDHPTPVEKRTHTLEPVPFLISGAGVSSSGVSSYSEKEAANSSLYFDKGWELLDYFLKI